MKRAAIAMTLLCSGLAFAQAPITASDAKNHVGENATVCGEVASAHYAQQSRGSPTFINLDKPYPNQIFTVVIWGSDRPKFDHPETTYSGKKICVTGRITQYRESPEIAIHDPSQVRKQ